jgi:hypothetical protein
MGIQLSLTKFVRGTSGYATGQLVKQFSLFHREPIEVEHSSITPNSRVLLMNLGFWIQQEIGY